MADGKNEQFRIVCRVLMCISDSAEPLHHADVMKITDLSYERVKCSIRQLRIKQKIKVAFERDGKEYFEFNEDYTPPKRKPIVRAKTKAGKEASNNAPLCIVNRYKFVNQKVALLKRLLRVVNSDNDRDLLEGIIRDYNPDAKL